MLSITFTNGDCNPSMNIPRIRRPVVEGMFYPEDTHTLHHTVQHLLDLVPDTDPPHMPFGMIVPHAGYVYSGLTAAHAYKSIQGKNIDTIILIGPSHHIPVSGISVYPAGDYITPLGPVPIDASIAEIFLQWKYGECIITAHQEEHSLEVQLPFLQVILDTFAIVPILMGNQSQSMAQKLAQLLLSVIKTSKKRILFIASTDLSHYHTAAAAQHMDSKVLPLIETIDPDALCRFRDEGLIEACGAGPMAALLYAAQQTGITRGLIKHVTHSGVASGDHNRVVGYVSAVLYA